MKVFFDMDGVLAKWRNVPFDEVMEPGYFLTPEPEETMVEAARILNKKCDVYIASKVVNEEAMKDKSHWLDVHMPFIPESARFFIRYEAERKCDGIPLKIESGDILLDDNNRFGLYDWPGTPVKVLNGINNSHRTWDGFVVSTQQRPEVIVATVLMIGLT